MTFATGRDGCTAKLAGYPARTVAGQKSKRRSRKRRNPETAPKAVPSQRREQRADRQVTAERQQRRSQSRLGVRGERPPSPFGGLPVSEVMIFAGLVSLIVWLFNRGKAELVVGSVVCALGVIEVTAREHFSGYRSHTTLLAAIPAVLIEVGLFAAGVRPRARALLLLAVVPVFALCFWLLQKRFKTARQARVARPPAP
jgi:hypothetical protein